MLVAGLRYFGRVLELENRSNINFISRAGTSSFALSIHKAFALSIYTHFPNIVMNPTKHTSNIAPNYRFVHSNDTRQLETDHKKQAAEGFKALVPLVSVETEHKWARRHSIDSAGGGYEGL